MDLDAMRRAILLGKRDSRYYDEMESRERIIADAIRRRRGDPYSSLHQVPDDQLVQDTMNYVFHPDNEHFNQKDSIIQKLIAHNNIHQYMELEDQQPQVYQRLRQLLGVSPGTSISPPPRRRVYSAPTALHYYKGMGVRPKRSRRRRGRGTRGKRKGKVRGTKKHH